MEIHTAVNLYRDHMALTVKLKRNTVRGRIQEPRKLAEFLSADDLYDTRDLAKEGLGAYAKTDRYVGLADHTYNLYISHLKQFLQWLRTESLLGDDPCPEKHLLPRRNPIARRAKARIKASEIDGIANLGADWHIRDKYLIYALYYMTRRAGEVLTMTIGDLDLSPSPQFEHGRYMFTNHKGVKAPQARPLRKKMSRLLAEWLEIYSRQIGRRLQHSDFLFPALDAGSGACWPGQRRNMVICPTRRMSYDAARTAMYRVGVRGTHAGRRGGLDEIAAKWGIAAAKVSADHSSEAVTEKYIDRSREVDNLAKLFSKEDKKKTKKKKKVKAPAADVPGVISLAARRAQGRTTA